MFPSPYGELHFSIVKVTSQKDQKKVSVPLRGTTFLNDFASILASAQIAFPSPYGELHFSIHMTRSKIVATEEFPSPYGELHFSIRNTRD